MFLYIKRNKSGYPWILTEPRKLLLMVDDDLWAWNQKIVIHRIWNPRPCSSKAISFVIICVQETWNCSTAEFTIMRHSCLFVYFLLIGGNFKLGADGKKFMFLFQKFRTSREFCPPFNQPFVRRYFSKAQTLFYGSSEDGKSRLSQSTVTDVVCLMNLLFERSVKCQAHYTVLLECRGSRREWLSNYFWAVL